MLAKRVEDPPEQRLYFLKSRPEEWRPIWVRDVQRKVHCKSLELPLNYHQVMIRYQFRIPPKGRLEPEEWLEKCRRYIKKWIALIVAEKKRQMRAPQDMWPPWPDRSAVSTVFTMPIVLWLSKPRDCKRTSEGHKRITSGSRFFQSGEYSC